MAASDYRINLDGVTPAGVRQHIEPGTYRVKITSVDVDDETKYGPGVRFNFEIVEPEDEHNGFRSDFLLFIPSQKFREKAREVGAQKGKKNVDEYVDNFAGLMASKWKALVNALDFSISGDVDATKIANKSVGNQILVIVQRRKNLKPGENYTDVNGFEPVPANYGGGGSTTGTMSTGIMDDDGSEDDGDEFSLDDV